MVAAQCFSIFYTFSTFRTQPFIFQNIAFWSLSFVFQKSHDISAFPDYDTALSVRDRLDGPGFGLFGKSGNSNLQNSRVEAKVLFITCLYLLNPCDISAYTRLVAAVAVFWRAERKNESDIKTVNYYSRRNFPKMPLPTLPAPFYPLRRKALTW